MVVVQRNLTRLKSSTMLDSSNRTKGKQDTQQSEHTHTYTIDQTDGRRQPRAKRIGQTSTNALCSVWHLLSHADLSRDQTRTPPGSYPVRRTYVYNRHCRATEQRRG